LVITIHGVPVGVGVGLGLGIGVGVGVGVGLAALIVKVTVLEPVQPFFVANSVTVYVPAAVGIPEIKPVVVLTVKPGGKPVAL
jgi:hypothetical protein